MGAVSGLEKPCKVPGPPYNARPHPYPLPMYRERAMKPRNRSKHKGRSESGTFTMIPHAVQDCPNWRQCSATAIKMLCDVARQYNGRNNGDLCAAMSILKRYGWKHSETILLALRELRHYGFLLLTRQGGLHAPSLYAVTWHAIDDCGGKLECASTAVAPGHWKEPRDLFKRPPKKRKATTPFAADCYAIRSREPKKAA